MSIKYYTHFLLQERSPKGMSEFRGVVEVNRGRSERGRLGAGEELRVRVEGYQGSAMVAVALI
jgi:hypothetical protein